MNKRNGTIRNLARETIERRSPARACEKDSSEKSPNLMPLDGRIEKRIPMAVPVDLVMAEEMLVAERVLRLRGLCTRVKLVSGRLTVQVAATAAATRSELALTMTLSPSAHEVGDALP